MKRHHERPLGCRSDRKGDEAGFTLRIGERLEPLARERREPLGLQTVRLRLAPLPTGDGGWLGWGGGLLL